MPERRFLELCRRDSFASKEEADDWLRSLDVLARSIVKSGPGHPDFGHAFMRYYLPHYCMADGRFIEPAAWHDEFYGMVFGSLGTRAREVVEAFRESAKSTTASLAVPLAALALQLKHYIWIVQDTAPQAKQTMDAILAETEGNIRLRRDYPHLVPGVGRHSRPLADRDDDVIFASGQRLQALGAGQKLRGRRHRQHRPDLCIVDDLENDEAVLTKYQRDKLDSWASRSLMGALGPDADVYVLGTPLHYDAFLRRLPKRARWTGHTYPLLEDGFDDSTSTWPAWWTTERIAEKRAEVRSRDFAQEYLLNVQSEEDKMFPSTTFGYGRRPAQTEEEGVRVRIACDPATGLKARNDRSAVLVVMRRRGDARYHVEDAWADRVRGTPLRERIIATYERLKAEGFAPIVIFETVQAQEWGKQALEEEGIPVRGVSPHSDKLTRAEPVALHYEKHRVTHAEHLRDSDFEAELDQFPDGEHDDYVDALVYAILDLEHEPGAGVVGAVVVDQTKRAEEPFVDPRGT